MDGADESLKGDKHTESIYVLGHRNPDTDAIVSAMAYAALNNALGENNYIAGRIGHLNTETAFLLDRFGFKPPVYIRSVRTQVSDIDYDTPPALGEGVPVSHAWKVLQDQGNSLSALPVTHEDGTLFGLITAGGIAENDMESLRNPVVQSIPVFNLLGALEGHILNSPEDYFEEMSGEVVLALSGATPAFRPGNIVLCGNDPVVADQAIAAGASCIIFCQSEAADHYRNLSCSTCLMVTPFDAYRAARLLFQSVPVGRIASKNDLVYFHLNDYLDDVRDTVLKSRFRSYPVLNEEEKVVGTLSRYHLIKPRRKKIVLVDHNEMGQAVSGLEQAEIVGIIDHHRLADVQTGRPVFFRNEPIGSTTSIVASMYQEHGLLPSPSLAGLMAAAIISDTVLFKSPTCTPQDKILAERLARHAGIDLEELGKAMFTRGVSFDKPAAELIQGDMKEFHLGSHALAISQITCVDTAPLMKRLDEIVEALEYCRDEHHYEIMLLMITNVLKEGSELIFAGDPDVVRNAFGVEDLHDHHVFLPHVMSRKKQIVPALSQIWG